MYFVCNQAVVIKQEEGKHFRQNIVEEIGVSCNALEHAVVISIQHPTHWCDP